MSFMASSQDKPRPANNAARERCRVKTLRHAFLELQKSLPAVPPDTKLSKLDVLILATAYISHLTKILDGQPDQSEDRKKIRLPTDSCWVNSSPASTMTAVNASGRRTTTTTTTTSTRRLESLYQHGLHGFSSFTHVDKSKQESHHDGCGAEAGNHYWGPVNSLHTKKRYCSLNVKNQKHVHEMYNTEPRNKHLESGTQQQLKSGNCEHQLYISSKKSAFGILHPVKKWPMRCRLYDSILGCGSSHKKASSQDL